MRRLAKGRAIRDLVEPILGSGAFCVRGIYFDIADDSLLDGLSVTAVSLDGQSPVMSDARVGLHIAPAE